MHIILYCCEYKIDISIEKTKVTIYQEGYICRNSFTDFAYVTIKLCKILRLN